MNKTDLIEKIAMRTDLSKNKAALALDATMEEIIAALQRGDYVRLQGFGTFYVVESKARKYHNPRGGVFEVENRRYPKFRVAQAMKDVVK